MSPKDDFSESQNESEEKEVNRNAYQVKALVSKIYRPGLESALLGFEHASHHATTSRNHRKGREAGRVLD